MYKCSECGNKYDIKPDFCECGNDVFDEIEISISSATPVYPKQYSPETQYSETGNSYTNRPKKFDILSIIIFLSLLLSAFVVIFFIGNPKDISTKSNITNDNSKQTTTQDIPNIDKFWDNTMPVNNQKTAQNSQTNALKPEKTLSNNLKVPFLSENKPTPVNSKKTLPQKTNSSTATVKVVKKDTSNTSSNVTARIPANTLNAAKQKKQPKTTTQTVQQTVSAPVPKLQNSPVAQTKAQPPVQNKSVQSSVKPVVPVKSHAVLKQELDSYKVSLRNTLGRKIDFTKVVGDGSCIVSFQVSSSGALTNRSFAKQSSNITLNDAVYKAVMSTPRFNPPPEGYKNEMLKLNVTFTNGNFEIGLN